MNKSQSQPPSQQPPGEPEILMGEIPFQPSPNPDSGPGSGTEAETSGNGDDVDFPPEAAAALAVKVLDIYCTRRYRAPLTEIDAAMLMPPFVALARKYLSGPVSPEWAAVGALAVVVLPRHVAMMAEAKDNDRSGVGAEGVGEKPADSQSGGGAPDPVSAMLRSSP